MASTHKHIRSSTANKRPTTAIADGQVALNTNAASPGLFFKDSTGASIIKIGPVHVGSTAPNATPGAGGSAGNSTGEVWLDNSLSPVGVKIWDGSAWVNATPAGSTTVQGLLELATNAETQAGSDTARAVTSAGLQSKVSDSTSTTSSTTIASSTAVKAAYDLAAAALPLSGGIITGNLEIGTTGSLSFEGSTADAFETTIAVTNPTADRTITLPDQTGNFLVSGNASIVNADVNASAAIAGTKISPDFGSQTVVTTSVFSHALGAAATPSITFTGDLNTGIYSPGADQVAVATNGTGRLFVDASGNVGVGPISTSSFLSGSSTVLSLRDTATGNVASLKVLGGVGAGAIAEYGATNGIGFCGTSGAHDFTFYTNSTERLRITSAGLVGIGTSSPGAKLDVSGSGNLVRLGDGTNTFDVRFKGPNNWSTQLDTSADKFNIQRNSTSLVTVDSAGRLGVGTTSPSVKLEVSGSAASNPEIRCVDGNINSQWYQDSAGYSVFGTFSNHPQVFRTNGTERLRIDTSGRLLVGTSSSLDVNAGLQIAVNSSFSDFYPLQVFHFDSTDDTQGPTTIYTRSKSDTIGTVSAVNVNDGLGTILFRGAGTSTYVNGALIKAEVESGTVSNTSMPSRLVFSTTADGASSPTERMRISQNGKTDIYSSDYGLATRVSAAAGTSVAIYYGSYGATSTATGTVSYQVLSNGNVQNTNNSYGAYSDIKLKENIVDANSQWNDLKALRVRNYNLKEGQTHTQIGLVAQEIEPISPGLIYETPDRDEDGNDLGTVTKSVNYSVLYMKAVKALQEAMERIETLEARLTVAGIE